MRQRVVGSNLTIRQIADEVGMSSETVRRWIRRRGWTRPGSAPRSHGTASLERATPARRLRALARRAEALAERALAERSAAESGGAPRSRRDRQLAESLRETAGRLGRRANAKTPF
ncbi:MAG: helix-turn-helix domain-containing protein [Methylobacteriaceae bacterium]|nr:helix-turn-helix domain-containing protein [Methylobacteriaceae bacterium]